MPLYLVQHGKSLSKEEDPERGLSAEGIAEAERVGRQVRKGGVKVLAIRHSGKKRARQTAEIFASALLRRGGTVEAATGLAPQDDVALVAKGLNPKDAVMLVGHLPFMERLTSFLIRGDPEKPVLRFQNGGVVCLDRETEADTWVIRWVVVARLS